MVCDICGRKITKQLEGFTEKDLIAFKKSNFFQKANHQNHQNYICIIFRSNAI